MDREKDTVCAEAEENNHAPAETKKIKVSFWEVFSSYEFKRGKTAIFLLGLMVIVCLGYLVFVVIDTIKHGLSGLVFPGLAAFYYVCLGSKLLVKSFIEIKEELQVSLSDHHEVADPVDAVDPEKEELPNRDVSNPAAQKHTEE